MSERRLLGAAMACLVLGTGLTVATTRPLALTAGLLLLLGFVVLALVALAGPRRFGSESEDEP